MVAVQGTKRQPTVTTTDPKTTTRETEETTRCTAATERPELASLDIPPTLEEAELDALTDANQSTTKAPGTPTHTNSIEVSVRSSLARNQSSDGN